MAYQVCWGVEDVVFVKMLRGRKRTVEIGKGIEDVVFKKMLKRLKSHTHTIVILKNAATLIIN